MDEEVRIGIDARAILAPQKTGVQVYTYNLVRHLARLNDGPQILCYIDRSPSPGELGFELPSFMKLRPVSSQRGWLRLGLPMAVLRDRVKVMHFPGTLYPRWMPCRKVVTVYDIAFRHIPDAYAPGELRLQEKAVACARRAGAVLAISECTKRDLVNLCRVPEPRVHVTPLAAEEEFFQEPAVVLPPAGVPAGCLLFVGAITAKKNLRSLITAYAKARARGLKWPLVLAGPGQEDYVAGLVARIEELGLDKCVHFAGYIRREQLPSLYRSANAFVYPSLYEGFGLPVIEAMACGVPVVVSAASCLPEIVGDAALLAQPEDPNSIADALVALASNEELRRELGRKGQSRARSFSWERVATDTLQVYLRVAGKTARRI